ncbi:MAG: arylsulfatase [Phycisphaeraceae bacterium]
MSARKKSHSFTLSALLFVSLMAATPVTAADTGKRKPNVIFIMADDLGYAEVGCYGQKWIKTPSVDRISAQGIRFTQHYTAHPVCAPARCSLMTGKHGGHAFIRDNSNPPGRKTNIKNLEWTGQNPIPDEEVTMAELFKAQGYATGAMGKWGLGYEGSTGDPNKQGFDLFFGYLCQAHAHSHYPMFLWRNDQKVMYEGNERQLQGKHHSQDEFIAEAVKFVRANKDKPFFLYLPFAIPHLSIQVPEDSLAEYKGKIPEEEYVHKGYLKHPFPRAAYAAMITHMDRGIGQIMSLVKELGLDDDTIIIFTSDNGPTYDRLGGSDSVFFNSAGPLKAYKGSIYEGGIRIPCVVRWPGRIKAGQTTDLISYHPDWLPTLMDLIGASDTVPKDVDGISLAPTLLGNPKQKERDYIFFDFNGYGGQQAVRAGDWKAVRRNIHKGNITLELYNLKDDIGESKDVAGQHPDIIAKMEAVMKKEHTPSKLFPMKVLDGVK